jgi:hypothetical protein
LTSKTLDSCCIELDWIELRTIPVSSYGAMRQVTYSQSREIVPSPASVPKRPGRAGPALSKASDFAAGSEARSQLPEIDCQLPSPSPAYS